MQKCLHTLIVSTYHEYHTQTSGMLTNCTYMEEKHSW